MSRRSLRWISAFLKISCVLVFAVYVVMGTILKVQPYVYALSVDWLRFGYEVGSTLLSGLLLMAFTYGGAKVIDLLLEMEIGVRTVTAFIQQRRRTSAREDLAPVAPDPNRHIWSDHPGSIRDGRNLQKPVYDVNGQRIYRGKAKL